MIDRDVPAELGRTPRHWPPWKRPRCRAARSTHLRRRWTIPTSMPPHDGRRRLSHAQPAGPRRGLPGGSVDHPGRISGGRRNWASTLPRCSLNSGTRLRRSPIRGRSGWSDARSSRGARTLIRSFRANSTIYGPREASLIWADGIVCPHRWRWPTARAHLPGRKRQIDQHQQIEVGDRGLEFLLCDPLGALRTVALTELAVPSRSSSAATNLLINRASVLRPLR